MKPTGIALALVVLLGCAPPSSKTNHWESFAEKWRQASIQERKEMIDLSLLQEFVSKGREDVISVFGVPSFDGANDFGEHEIRYDFDPVPETDGAIFQHLTFIMEDDKVVRVELNIL
jgi:hypothetical protein